MFFQKKGLYFKRKIPKKIVSKLIDGINSRLIVMSRSGDYDYLYIRNNFISFSEATYMFNKIKHKYTILKKSDAIIPLSIKTNATKLAIRIMSFYGYNDKIWESFVIDLISLFNLDLFLGNSSQTLIEILKDYLEKNKTIKTDFMSFIMYEEIIPKKYIPDHEYIKLQRTENLEYSINDLFIHIVDYVFENAKKNSSHQESINIENAKAIFFENL